MHIFKPQTGKWACLQCGHSKKNTTYHFQDVSIYEYPDVHKQSSMAGLLCQNDIDMLENWDAHKITRQGVPVI